MNMNEYATGVYVHNAGYIMCHDIFSIYDIRGMFICSDGTLELYVKIRFLIEHFPWYMGGIELLQFTQP